MHQRPALHRPRLIPRVARALRAAAIDPPHHQPESFRRKVDSTIPGRRNHESTSPVNDPTLAMPCDDREPLTRKPPGIIPLAEYHQLPMAVRVPPLSSLLDRQKSPDQFLHVLPLWRSHQLAIPVHRPPLIPLPQPRRTIVRVELRDLIELRRQHGPALLVHEAPARAFPDFCQPPWRKWRDVIVVRRNDPRPLLDAC